MNCRHCGETLRTTFLDLGAAPPSNAYLSAETLRAPETWFPLRLLACSRCRLVQTEDYAGREALFTDSYAYFSSYSSTWLAHASAYVEMAVARFGLGPSQSVVEVAANDGYLLQYVKAKGIPCYGIEPTASTAKAARTKGIEIVERFFGRELALELAGKSGQADLMAANNVLAHVPDLADFVGGFAILLAPGGVATFEFPHLLRLVESNQFDTVYHEHFSYLSLLAVMEVFAANGLDVFDVEELPTHGGSLRVYAQRLDTLAHARTKAPARILAMERNAGMDHDAFYTGFQAKAEKVKDDVVHFLIECRRQGLKVGGYGAAAKGNTLLNFAGVRSDLLPYVVDKNPAKQGLFLPGSRIPIVNVERLLADKPDVVLVLPWNLREEIMAELAVIRDWGGRFATAVPSLTLWP